MGDTSPMHVIAYEGRVECPNCASPVFVPALVTETTCPSCQAAVPLTPMVSHMGWPAFWDNMLAGTAGWQLGPRDFEIESQHYISSREKVPAPICAACSAALDIRQLEGKSELTCDCGAVSSLRVAPHDGLIPRFVTHLVGEDPDALPGPEGGAVARPSKAAQEPVRFPCPACDASLTVDGSSRTVECSYCQTSAYLPNDLWRALHPVSTVKRWHLLVDEDLFQPFLRTRRTVNWWIRGGKLSALLALFIGPLLGASGHDKFGWIAWIPAVVFVACFALCFALGSRAETRHAETMK